MRIKGENWIISKKYLTLHLIEPYWSAWKQFGWTEGVEGYSISEVALNKAVEFNKKILVKNKYGDYEISNKKAQEFRHFQFMGRDGTILICIPKTAFNKLANETDEIININENAKLRLADEFFKKHPELRRAQI